jgi:hypothetical protein
MFTTKMKMKRFSFLLTLLSLFLIGDGVWGQTQITPTRTSVSGFSSWTDTGISGTAYLKLLSSNSETITPDLDFTLYGAKELNFVARTFGGSNAAANTVTVSISVGYGAWSVIGSRTPNNNNLNPMTNFDLTAYTGSQVRLRFQSLDGTGSVGIGIDDISIMGLAPSVPTLTATPSSLSGLNYVVGNGPSGVQSFELSGTNLDGTSVELATIIDDCEISLSSNSGFSNYIELPSYNGTATTIFVRLKAGLIVDSYIDQVLITGGGVASANEPEIDLSGDVWLTAPPIVYCTPTYSLGTLSNDWFSNVSLESLNHTSTKSSDPFYTLYNSVTVPDIVIGGNVDVSVTVENDANQYVGVWIDVNQNGTFEPIEGLMSGNAGSNGTVTLSFTVPLTAVLGNTRMRIRGGDDSSINDTQACAASNSSYGETKDYIVNITAPCSVSTPSLPSSTQSCGSKEFAATANSGTESTYWQTSASGTSTSDPANVTKTVPASTTIYLRTFSSSANCWSAPLTVTPTVSENPVISTHPVDQSDVVGQNITFSVTATNANSYQWQVSADNGGSWSFMPGEVSGTLDLSGVSLAMNGNLYRVNVIANSPCSDVLSNTATLSVVSGPCLDEANFTVTPAGWSDTNITYSSDEANFASHSGELTTLSLSNPNSLTFDLRRTGNTSAKTLYVEVSTTTQGGTYSIIETFYHGNTASSSTTNCTVDLSAYSSSPTVFIRFRKASSTTSPWYMQNVQVFCGSAPPICTPSASISSFMPASGPAETLITITGSGFTGTTEVKFGSINSLSYTVVDDNTIIAEVPTGIGTSESIYVFDAASCEAVSASSFTYITNNGTCTDYPGYTDLFISEVYDSNGNNEWLVELFNPTANPIALDGVYDVKRAGDIAVSPIYSRTINLTGVVAANSVYTLNIGTGSSCSVSYDFTEPGGGINENDMITLFKNGGLVDVVHAPNNIGYSLLRNIGTGVVAPSDTYIPVDWTISNSESCDDLGTFVLPPSTVIDITSSPIDISDCSLTMSVSSSTSGVSYKWKYNDLSTMAGWSDVNATNISVGTVSGESTSTLTISGDVFALMDFQFYCEVSNGTCGLASNAAQFKIDSKPIYRSISSANGDWSDYTNWEMSTDFTNYSAACTYPRENNSSQVIIQGGAYIIYDLSGADEITIDKVTIETNGTLEISPSSKLTINDSVSGADLIVNGTLYDRANSSNSLTFSSGTTWELGGGGKMIKSNAGAVSLYRDNYEGGMSSIPASANWIYRYNGDGNPSVGAVNFFYPNLSFENTTNSAYSWNTVGSLFDGSTGGFTTVKGDFIIGVNGISGCIVSNVNFNTQPMLILGNLFIATDSKLINRNANSTVFGSGFELKGNATVNGELDLLGGTTERILRITGTSDQNISGSGAIGLYKVIVNKSGGSVIMNRDLKIQNELIMTNGNIFSSSNVLELGLSTIQKGVLSHTSGFVIGKMRRWFDGTNSGNSSSLFPIGYNEFGVKNRNTKIEFDNAPSHGGHLTVEYIGAPMTYDGLPIFAGNTNGAGFDVTTAEDQGFWKIENESGKLTDGDYTISCTGEGYLTVTDLLKLTLLKRVVTNSPNWFCPGSHEATTGSISSPVVSRSGVSGWSNFGFGGGPGNPLPVTLTSFEVDCPENENRININWSTASETNSSHFTVEKSRDMVNWRTVANTQAAGNSNYYIDYSEVDENPSNGITYYRLSQLDFDGKMEVFDAVSVSCGMSENNINVYPNPSNGEFTLEIVWTENSVQTEMQILDMTGRVISTQDIKLEKGVKQLYINETYLQKGTYLIVFPNTELEPIRILIK